MGNFSLSGVFPEAPLQAGSSGPLTLVLCTNCSLVQLSETYNPNEMFGDNYGYRSGLNSSMQSHLKDIVAQAESLIQLVKGDVVLDIGSNDGTLLRSYKSPLQKIGIDPSGLKFSEYYDDDSLLVPSFFSSRVFFENASSPAKVITSIAMLYDLEDPVDFATQVAECLDEEGVWIFEQSYMPWMILTGAFDTICHEHIEYYSLTSIQEILSRSGLKALDVQINSSNGGSFRVVAAKENSVREADPSVKIIGDLERAWNIWSPEFFEDFANYVMTYRDEFIHVLHSLKSQGKAIGALGASTKGGILLQLCRASAADIAFIGEVNPFKFGRWMANSDIPIVQETDSLLKSCDALIVLPWHFREGFTSRLKEFVAQGGQVVFPLPSISTLSDSGLKVLHSISSRYSFPEALKYTAH
jgi:hypothetical protein